MGRPKLPEDDTCLPRLRRAALRQFVAQGYDGASVRMISGAAGVSEAALYRHYRSKEDLARDLFLTGLADLTRALRAAVEAESTAAGKIRVLVRVYARSYDNDPDLQSYLIQAQHRMLGGNIPAPDNPRYLVREIVTLGQASGEFAAGAPELCAAAIIGMIERVAVFHVYGALDGFMAREADTLADLAVRALRLR